MRLKKVQRMQQPIIDEGYITEIYNHSQGTTAQEILGDLCYNQVPGKKNPVLDVHFNLEGVKSAVSLRKLRNDGGTMFCTVWGSNDPNSTFSFSGKEFVVGEAVYSKYDISPKTIKYAEVTEEQDFQNRVAIPMYDVYKAAFLLYSDIKALLDNNDCSLSTINEVLKKYVQK